MSIPKSVSLVLESHVVLETECIDRMYLNVYVPQLQRVEGIVGFFRIHRKAIFASSALMDPITRAFIKQIDNFAAGNNIPVVTFTKGQRKDDVAKEHLANFTGDEGILFIGKAQEKARVFRTEKRTSPKTGQTYPWIVPGSAMVNHYYFYCVDRDFGPFFIKFCSYFPYNGKLCINGHEYVKRQLVKEGIEFQPLDNGIASCENPKRLQELCDGLCAEKIAALFAKWQAILPDPFTPDDRQAGFRHALSILQIELSLTQVLDRPVTGRVFFEHVIRENLDIGRPDQVQLIFARRINKRTPGRFRTRVITEGVVPSLHLDYKRTRIKQYHKEGQALRTETTINDTRDFALGKLLTANNLNALRQVGFQANRRLLNVQKISCDPAVGEEVIRSMQSPLTVNAVRVSSLPFADERAQYLLQALPIFRLQPNGFANKELRQHLAPLLGKTVEQLTQGQMTYNLRRLRLRGLIERIPKTHRYQVTDKGLRVALFYTHTYNKILRRGLAEIFTEETPINTAFQTLQKALERQHAMQNFAA